MVPSKTITLALGLLLSFPSLIYAGKVQKPDLVLPPGAQVHRDAVEKIFVTSYEAYQKYARGHDDLLPGSKGFTDGRNGWGASIIDAMSTMYIMGLNKFFDEAVEFAGNIDSSKSQTPDTVSVFETTIRYLGGLLSAYELSGRVHGVLLDKAKEVADKMAFAWVDGNDVPYGHIDFSTNNPTRSTSNIAEAGTLTLEWATLSKYTANDTYRQLAEKSALHIANLGAPLPGLPAQGINPDGGEAVGSYVTWGGGSDSYLEYLIKYARLNNTADATYADSWRTAVDSSISSLLKTSDVGNNVFLADFDQSRIIEVGSHLACFHGGNWLFGGKLLNNQTIVNHGIELVDSCWNTYASTATGIGPEGFVYKFSDGNFGTATPTPEQTAFFIEHGFYITASYYILRPEVLESNFYAWRVTGDEKYLDRAASAIESFNTYLTSTVAFGGIFDVNSKTSQKSNDMESFWFAEVLKYLYLTFDDPTHISLDEYVFNTEAHPFKIPSAERTYGTGTLRPSKAFTPTSGELPVVSPIPSLPQANLGSL